MKIDLYPRLLGDIGGTNARFAWREAPGAPITHIQTLPCAEHASIGAAIESYLSTQQLERPRAASLGIAYPIQGDAVRMTNAAWAFSIRELQQTLGLTQLTVINDFTALALALPGLQPEQLHRLGDGQQAVPRAAMAVLGAGTGLGVGGLMPVAQGGWCPVSGEGGHASLAGADAFEDTVIERLRQRFGHVSAERALSGPGLVNLYSVCADLEGREAPPLQPADVLQRAELGEPTANQAVALFCSFLGSVAGSLALTLGARGGVYIGGGIAPRLMPTLRSSNFRTRFEAKGRLAPYLAAIPVYVIDAAVSPALEGASEALDLGL